MAGYIGHKPKLAKYAVDEFTTSAAQASSGNFTLSQTVDDSKTLEVSVGGIDQPQSAYTVTGTTLAFGASIVAENDIVIARHAGESISYPSLEDGAVTDAKIGTGAVTDGKLAASGTMPAWNGAALTNIVHTPADASVTNAKTNFLPGTTFKGDGSSARGKITLNCEMNTHGVSIQSPAHSSAAAYTLTLPPNDGTANQLLKTDGSGVLSFADAAAGGAWTLIGTEVASGSPTTLTVPGLDLTYDTYAIIGEMLGPNSSSHCWLRFGDSGGIDSGGSDYANHVIIQEIGSTGYNASSDSTTDRMKLMVGNGISGTTSFSAILHGNKGSSSYTHKPMIKGTIYYTSTGQKSALFSGWRLANMIVTQVQFGFVSGEVAYGRLSVWGISHA